MASLLKLAPRHFIELPDQPWLQPVYERFGTARAFLDAAAQRSGQNWHFEGPLVLSEWYGRRELWYLEESPLEPSTTASILSVRKEAEAIFPTLLPQAEMGEMGIVTGRLDGMALEELETEWVQVDDQLQFRWHRPPLETVQRQAEDPATVRIFLNGCFDLMHVGHFNALRQAKRLFYQLGFQKVVMVAGIHSDAAICQQKGPPMMSDEERIAVLAATKWVDELVTQLPYTKMSVKMADRPRSL
eukprot:g30491.t1